MEHYYLINGTVKKGDEMPENNINTPKVKLCHEMKFEQWKSSLQPCEISESEFEKIDSYFYEKWYQNNNGFDSHKQMVEYNPIDITDIVEEKLSHQLLSIPPIDVYKIYFKQPTEKKVESDAPEFLKWVWLNKYTDNNDAEELYEIFKNR